VITKLVIGPLKSGAVDETNSPHEAHPRHIREWVEQCDASKTCWTVCTFSPTVIRAVIDAWDKDPETFSRIVLRSDDGKATSLLDVKTPNWLAHFAIEDLYIHGEFDEFLKGDSSGD
jgi:hypothetical protein